jgi:hypothetical protein
MLGKLFLFAIAAAAAYFAARRLIDHPAIIDELPEPAREPVHELRERLIDLDNLIREVLAEVSSERRRAEEELREEYLGNVRRRESDYAPPPPFEAAPDRD